MIIKSFGYLLCASVWLIGGPGTKLAQSQKVPVLDLTKAPPADQSAALALGLPGGAISGMPGAATPLPYRLPILISIVSAKPNASAKGSQWIVCLSLTNMSASPYLLPAARDKKVHLPGNEGRRDFAFLVELEGAKLGETKVLAVTDASKTAADSTLRIGPGRTVRVLLPLRISDLKDVSSRGLQRISVRFGCQESRYADERYSIEAESEEVWSHKTIQIDLGSGKVLP